jgi:Na+/melibiose symporter-like transporter
MLISARRATIFLRVNIGVLLAQVAATSISAAVMKFSGPWAAVALGYIFVIMASSLTPLLPETRPESGVAPREPLWKTPNGGRSFLLEGLQVLIQSLRLFFDNAKVFVILLTFLASTMGTAVLTIGVQYISHRFDWTIAGANLLFSARAAVNAVLFIIVFPAVTHVISKKFSMTPFMKDLCLAQISVWFLPLGFLIMAVASNIALLTAGLMVTTLGTGYPSLMRSLATSVVEEDYLARLSSAITVFETLGSIISSPVLAGFFHWGLHLGGLWQGLPFFAATLITSLAGVLVSSIRLPPSSRVETGSSQGRSP